jgi:hypothetical protein
MGQEKTRGMKPLRMNTKLLPYRLITFVAVFVILMLLPQWVGAGGAQIPLPEKGSSSDPLNATYMIEGQATHLVNGRSEREVAPGSATKIMTSVFGKPVEGDLDGQGDMDVALLLVHDPGGSGTFYYVAAALNRDDSYIGTNAVLLGDRIAPQDVKIRNGVVVANYTDRRPEEPMSVSPSVGKSKYLILKKDELAEIKPLGEGEQVLEGWVTIGHEVRSFLPCSKDRALWLLGNSPAMKEVKDSYWEALLQAKPYTPLFMTLAGKMAGPPTDGFGAEYEAAFLATQLVRVSPKGNCRSENIVVDSPAPGAVVASPLIIRGHARGAWFFEGDFPVLLRDSDEKVIATRFCTAKDAWMTQRFVPFEGVIAFKRPRSGNKGTLVLKKHNPTGRPEHDDAVEIPVFFE